MTKTKAFSINTAVAGAVWCVLSTGDKSTVGCMKKAATVEIEDVIEYHRGSLLGLYELMCSTHKIRPKSAIKRLRKSNIKAWPQHTTQTV